MNIRFSTLASDERRSIYRDTNYADVQLRSTRNLLATCTENKTKQKEKKISIDEKPKKKKRRNCSKIVKAEQTCNENRNGAIPSVTGRHGWSRKVSVSIRDECDYHSRSCWFTGSAGTGTHRRADVETGRWKTVQVPGDFASGPAFDKYPEFDKCLWRAITRFPTCFSTILSRQPRSINRASLPPFSYVPSNVENYDTLSLFFFLFFSPLTLISINSLRRYARFLNIHDRRLYRLSSFVFDWPETRSEGEGVGGSKLTNKWHE